MERISQHAACIAIMAVIYFAGVQWGKMSDERRRRKIQKRIWQQAQAKLPKASR
jgi:hypothetical protein